MGAGPAGVAASIVLKQVGYSVMLVDQVKTERLKVGESVPGAASRLLQRLGLEGIDALLTNTEYVPSTANASAWGSDHWTFQDAMMNPQGGGWHVLRHRFDEKLRQHALSMGVEYHAGQVSRYDRAEDYYQVQLKAAPESLKARWLLDATGRKGLLVRKLGGERQRFSEQYAVIVWTRTHADDLDQTTRVKSVPEGWWYTSKLPGGLRVSALQCLPELAARLAQEPEAFFAAWDASGIKNFPLRPEDMVQPLSVCDASVQKSQQAYGENWLAVGDAVMSFDPLSSQGIFFALYSGVRGGEAVAACLQQPMNASALLSQYQQRVEQVFQANMRSRSQFYHAELRYKQEAYWKQQVSMLRAKW